MRKNYAFVGLLIATVGSLAFMRSNDQSITARKAYKNSHLANASGAPTGRTGAPGESNCTECHSGSVQSGNGINQVIFTEGGNAVTSYTPGTTYNVAVGLNPGGAKNGFEIVALSPSNAQAGSITVIPGTGSQVLNGAAGKKYVTHTGSGNMQNAWAFQWTAPATNVGTVTFYLATNQTNNNNASSGDVIRLSQHTIGSTASISENAETIGLSVGHNAATNALNLHFATLTAGEGSINLVDLSGKSVLQENLGSISVGDNEQAVKLPSDLKAGIYMVHLNINNNFVSKKIYIGATN